MHLFTPIYAPLYCSLAKRKATPSPEAAAQAKFDRILYFYGERQLEAEACAALSYMKSITVPREHVHLTCRAGRSGFWMTWTGDLLPCGMFSGPKISLLDHTFAEGWTYITEKTAKLEMHTGCAVCKSGSAASCAVRAASPNPAT